MAKPRKELRMTLVIRANTAPRVLEAIADVERGNLNRRIVEMLNLAATGGAAPTDEAGASYMSALIGRLEAIIKRLDRIGTGSEAGVAAATKAGHRRDTQTQPTASRPEPLRQERQEAEQNAPGREVHDPSVGPTDDEIKAARSLVDNLGVD